MARDASDSQCAFHQLVEALRLAALPAEQQVAVLPDFVHVPDEVALIYYDAFLGVPQLLETDVVTAEQVEPLRALDQLFAEMTDAPDKESVWTRSAMEEDERWARTRTLALAALTAIGASSGHPRFDGTTWVKGY